MARLLQLTALLLVVTFTAAQLPKAKLPKKYDPDNSQTPPSLLAILQAPDEYAPPSLSLNLEVPREEAGVPFYTPEPVPIAILKAPQLPYYNVPIDFNAPVPSQELQVPSIEPWNPNNDPKLYYELPAAVTKQEAPTHLYPKKFNKDVHEKQKPLANKPKQEISLVPISERDYLDKQRGVNKVILTLAKAQNQKEIEAEKVEESKEPLAAASGFSSGFNLEGASGKGFGVNQFQPAAEGFSSNLHHASAVSADLHHHPAPNKRLEFQMHGHDGPNSYKWGFDTGKGHNRQFRYEERDGHGYVKGHYGYYNKHGKLRMVHYDAHPHEGFHAADDR